jgi:hypothetical protein
MSRSIVPVLISPHLVPFFFQEFEGIEAYYLGKKVKAAKISCNKPLGTILRLLMEKTTTPVKADKFYMYLSIQDREQSKEFFGKIYKCANGERSFLQLPKEGVKLLNDHLEDVFRTSLVTFVEGHKADNSKAEIRRAIDLFLQRYDLYEEGFGIEGLRRYYYRVIDDGHLLKRLQSSGFISKQAGRVTP